MKHLLTLTLIATYLLSAEIKTSDLLFVNGYALSLDGPIVETNSTQKISGIETAVVIGKLAKTNQK